MTLNLRSIITAINRIVESVRLLSFSIERQILSGSTSGQQIKVAATATPGTLVHTASKAMIDEVTLYGVNSSAAAVKVTLEWGTTTAPDGNIEITIQPESGYVLLTDGLPLTNALVIRAFAATANVILINGYVKRLRI